MVVIFTTVVFKHLSLVVKWLRPHASTAGGTRLGLSLIEEIRYWMPRCQKNVYPKMQWNFILCK